MAARVVGQQAVHDLRRGRDQHAMGGQGVRQRRGVDEAVGVVCRFDSGFDAAPPRIPDHLADFDRALGLTGQTRTPRLLQGGNRAIIQRQRPQVRQVIKVLHAERQGHLEIPCSCF
ncbi:hypothetical protein QFZ38_005084 [Pseudomonas cedrina]|nr:hypothetical protein [Pseudomonas cedrina]